MNFARIGILLAWLTLGSGLLGLVGIVFEFMNLSSYDDIDVDFGSKLNLAFASIYLGVALGILAQIGTAVNRQYPADEEDSQPGIEPGKSV